MQTYRRLLTLFALAFVLLGCRIIQEVPAGGYVESRTGNNDCAANETCIIDIESGSTFSDTFTAIPHEGYRFDRWGDGLCVRRDNECRLEGLNELFTIYEFDAYLSPVFLPITINDTGMDFGGNYPEGNNLGCTGETVDAQDCSSGRDVEFNENEDGVRGFSFTKLDAKSGKDVPMTENIRGNWGCVRDNVTGLVWQARTVGVVKYPWKWRTVAANEANDSKLCGYKDWRVPTTAELLGVINLGTLDQTGTGQRSLLNLARENYWTNTGSVRSEDDAFAVDVIDGDVFMNDRRTRMPVMVVRGGAAPTGESSVCSGGAAAATPNSQFIDNGDDTVSHLTTALMWRKCYEGQTGVFNCAPEAPPTYNWRAALQYVQDLNASGGFAGYTDWRLPNIKELHSIADESCTFPAINQGVFPPVPNEFFWSSTPDASSDHHAWTVYFAIGGTGTSYREDQLRIRLVRDLY